MVTILHPSNLAQYMDMNLADVGATVSAKPGEALLFYGDTWQQRICVFDDIRKTAQCTPMFISSDNTAKWKVSYTVGWKKESSVSTSLSTPMYKKPSDLRPISEFLETEFNSRMRAVEPKFLFDKLEQFLRTKVDLEKWDRNLYHDKWERISTEDSVTVRFTGISKPSAFENKWYHMFLEATIPKGDVAIQKLYADPDSTMWRYSTAQTFHYNSIYKGLSIVKASVDMMQELWHGYYYVDYLLGTVTPAVKQWGEFAVTPEPVPTVGLRLTKPDLSWKAFFHRVDVEDKIAQLSERIDGFDPDASEITDEILQAIKDKYHLDVTSLSYDLADVLALGQDPLTLISEWRSGREKYASITLGRDTAAYWNSIMYDDAIVNAAMTKLGNETAIIDFDNNDADPTDGEYDDVDYLTETEFGAQNRYPPNYVCRMLNGVGFSAADVGQNRAFKWDGNPDFMRDPLVSIQFQGSNVFGTKVWFTQHLILMIDTLMGASRFRAFLRIPAGCSDDTAIQQWIIPGIKELVEYMSNGRDLSFDVPASEYVNFSRAYKAVMADIASKAALGAVVGTTVSPGVGTLIGALGGTILGAASTIMDSESVVNAAYDVNSFFQSGMSSYISGLNGLPLASYVLDLAVRLDVNDEYFRSPMILTPKGGCTLANEAPSTQALMSSIAVMSVVTSCCYAAGSRRYYHKKYDYKQPWKRKWVFVPGTIAQTAVSALTGATTAAMGAAYSATSNLGGAIKGMIDQQEPVTFDDSAVMDKLEDIEEAVNERAIKYYY